MQLTSARLSLLRLNAGRLAYAANAPLPPIIVSPPPGATHVELAPLLEWATTPGEVGPFTFDVYFGRDPNPPLAAAALTNPSWQTPPLLGTEAFYWRVVVRNPMGVATSPILRFTTGPRYATVLVGGRDVTLDHVDANAPLRYERVLDGRPSLSVTFESSVGGWAPEDGAEIVVLDGDTRVFGGMLVEPQTTNSPGTQSLVYSCQGTDYAAICDRRLVARPYTNATLRTIVVSIVVNDLAGEGLDVAGVEDGPVILKAVFNWITATEAFNQLAELTGMSWWIDPHKVLHFRDRSSVRGVADLTPDTVGSITVRPDRQQYRNHQVLRFGGGLTDARTERFVGDGERQTFNLSFAAGTEPAITVNGAVKRVGIKGVEEGFDWYWNKTKTELSQADTLPPLTPAEELSVTYRGLFPGIIAGADGPEVSRRRAIEGGSGRYMRVEERPNVQTTEAAVQVLQSMLDRFAHMGRVLSCATAIPGFLPGQFVTVNLPNYGIAGETFLIESVSAEIPAGNDSFEYKLTAISGDPYGGWQAYFRRLQRAGREFVINENEVVIGLTQWGDTADALDVSFTAALSVPESRIGDGARIGFSIVGTTGGAA